MTGRAIIGADQTGAVESIEASAFRPRPSLSTLLLVPALAFLLVFFVYPMVNVVTRSFSGPRGPSLEHYAYIFQRPVYLQVFWITFQISGLVTVFALLFGYPLAYLIATARPPISRLLLALVLVPFFTDTLVRTYSWMVILGPTGIVNQALRAIGLSPITLMYNIYAVLIGMTYTLLPYMVLTLQSVMRGIDKNLTQAAHNLGASDWAAFRRIFLPLTLPGIVGGCLLVFMLALGYFVTPSLLGGRSQQMVAMLIIRDIELAFEWNVASAVTIILVFLVLGGFLLFDRLLGLRALFENKLS
jgi:putative spermidine/putrescine transport system permease protein